MLAVPALWCLVVIWMVNFTHSGQPGLFRWHRSNLVMTATIKYAWHMCHMNSQHDDVIKWKHFPRHWPFSVGNSPVTGEFPSQRPVTRSFAVFFDLRLNQRWANDGDADDLRRHCTHYDVTVMGTDDINTTKQSKTKPVYLLSDMLYVYPCVKCCALLRYAIFRAKLLMRLYMTNKHKSMYTLH